MSFENLSENHRRIERHFLRSLYDVSLEIEELLEEPRESPFSDLEMDLTQEQKSAIRDSVQSLRKELEHSLESFNHEYSRKLSVKWAITVILKHAQVMIHSNDPKRISGYGDFSREEQEQISALNDHLAAGLEEIRKGLG